MAAGKLLVTEAGGICTDMKGAPHHLRASHILTDNALIHAEVLGLFSAIFRGEYPHAMPAMPSQNCE
jgi:3'-phosphoadenosine 5'-phosphosulfate (PAPS) 3'-phosphatase